MYGYPSAIGKLTGLKEVLAVIYCAHENGFHAGIQVTELNVQEGFFFVSQEAHFQHGKNN